MSKAEYQRSIAAEQSPFYGQNPRQAQHYTPQSHGYEYNLGYNVPARNQDYSSQYEAHAGQSHQHFGQNQAPDSSLAASPYHASPQQHPTADLDLPPAYSSRAEMLPCVIPQIKSTFKGAFMSPFVRAYPPAFHERGIDEARFLQFLDGFNEAFVATPALQATNTAGMIMGQFYGLHPVQFAGMGLQLASGLGSAAISILRAKAYMKAANAELFHPKGMHAQVLTTKKLLPKIKYPHEKLKLLPIDRSQEGQDDRAAEAVVPGHQALTRRHEALDGYAQPLKFEVAPSVESENLLKRMGEWQAKRMAAKQLKKLDKGRLKDKKEHAKKGKDADKEERKMEKELFKLEHELQKEQFKADSKIAKEQQKGDFKKVEEAKREFEKEARKIEKERAKAMREGGKEVDKHRTEAEKELTKTERKEEKTANKVRWIVIMDWEPETAGDEVEEDDSPDDQKS